MIHRKKSVMKVKRKEFKHKGHDPYRVLREVSQREKEQKKKLTATLTGCYAKLAKSAKKNMKKTSTDYAALTGCYANYADFFSLHLRNQRIISNAGVMIRNPYRAVQVYIIKSSSH